jgi:hypothetical protein
MNTGGGAEGAPEGPVGCNSSFGFNLQRDGMRSQTFIVESLMDAKKDQRESDRKKGWVAVRFALNGDTNAVQARTSNPAETVAAANAQLSSEDPKLLNVQHVQEVPPGDEGYDGQVILAPAITAQVEAINALVTGDLEEPRIGVNIICSDGN